MAGTIELSRYNHLVDGNSGFHHLIAAFDEPVSGPYPKQDGSGQINITFLLERYPYPDHVVLDLSTSPELWSEKIHREVDKHLRSDKPIEEFKQLRIVQLNLFGRGSSRIRYDGFIVVNMGLDLRPMRYASVPDHLFHVVTRLAESESHPEFWQL